MRTPVLAVVALLCSVHTITAQREEAFRTRLAPVPLDIAMRAVTTGKGSARAVLVGARLSITGSFEGLPAAATVARLHLSPVTGVRGTTIHDLAITKATSGTITGSIELTADQVEKLRKGRFYIQIHSEKAPEGNLWGWLLR